MEAFPAVDPIPLPAPVWLFVALHTLTLVLHFVFMQLLVGGLMVATLWSFLGRWRKDEGLLSGSASIRRKLPVIMTYVINLGVPPLLFTQVLFGRALYTSSILIGAWWISVIVLLMVGYSLLYFVIRRDETGKPAGFYSLLALLVIMMIGMIYSTNMALMLRPDTWAHVYRASPMGLSFHTGDHTVTPRWLFMMLGSLTVAGAGLLVMSLGRDVSEAARAMLRRWGGLLAAGFAVVQILLGGWAFMAQPAAVRSLFTEVAFYNVCAAGWLLTTVGLIVVGVLAARATAPATRLVWGAAAVSFLNITMIVLVRDGIRYAALKHAGFSGWDRAVSTNWSTVILFFVCFVAALAVVGWLVTVVARAKPVAEKYV